MFVLFKYLHVLTVVAAVVTALIPEVVLHGVARTGNVAAIRGLMTVIDRISRWIAPLFLLAALFGFVAVFTGQFDPFRPWLIASYVLFVIAMAVGALVSSPWAVRVGAAAAASPVESPSDELRAAIHDRRGAISTAILLTIIATIIFLMVVKPGG